MQKLIDFLFKKFGIWPIFIALLTVLGLCIKGFVWRSNKLMFSADNELLDSRFFYTPADVQSFFADLKEIDTNIYIAPNGIDLYKLTQVSLDLIFPFAYGILFAALIFLLYKKENKKNCLRWLLWIPVLATAGDIGENITTAILAWSYSSFSSSLWMALAWIASIFTFTKWIMVFSSLLIIVIGIVLLEKVKIFWKYYIFSLRIPIITGLLLFFFPILANTIASSLIQNIFVMRGSVQLVVVMVGATMAALMVSFSFERIFEKIPKIKSFNKEDKPFKEEITPSIRCIFVVFLVFSNWIPVMVLSRSELTGHSLGIGFLIGLALSVSLAVVIDRFGKALGIWLKLRLKEIVFLSQKITSKYAKVTLKQESWGKKFFSFLRLVIRKLKLNISKKNEEDFLGLSLGIIGTIIYLFFLIIYQPGSDIVSKVGEAPALLFVYLLFWILTGIFSTGTFFFDRFQVPFVVLLVLLSGFGYWFFEVDHFFELTKIENQSQQITLETALNERLLKQKNGRTLVVVAASGGGIQASGWTAQVLGGLQEELGSSFTQSIGLISSVSGGSVGTMYFIDDNFVQEKDDSSTKEKNGQKHYCINVNNDDKDKDDLMFKNNEALDNIFCHATEDWLDAVVWGAAYPDLIRLTGWLSPFIGKYNDRGYALEHDWQMNMYSPESTLNNWREKIESGDIPIPIFNATLVEDGRRFLISPIKLIEKNIEELVNSNDKDRKVLDFQTLYPGYDLKMSTAARLSATFPYVSPLPRNYPDVCYDISPLDEQFCGNYHFADGGYFDGSGIFTAVELIDNNFEALTEELNIKRILLLHIIPFPESKLETGSKGDRGWFMESIGPLTAAYAVRDSTQSSRNLKEFELLENRVNSEDVEIELFTIPFPKKNAEAETEEEYVQPLSWRLTQQQKKNLKFAWRDFKKTNNFQELKTLWEEWQK